MIFPSSGGECKDDFCRIVNKCTDLLPEDKPRYLMGVGFAADLVVCVALGIDMFDCVFPTRTAVCSLFPFFQALHSFKTNLYAKKLNEFPCIVFK